MSNLRDPAGPPDGFSVPGPVLALFFLAACVFFIAGWMENVLLWRDPVVGAEGDFALNMVASIWLLAGGLVLWVLSTPRGASRRRRPATAKPRFPLCANCMRPYVEGAHFCPACARPLTFFAATGGYEQVHARAWMLGKAANHPSRPMHVWGLTVVAAATVLSLLSFLYGVLAGVVGSTPYGGGVSGAFMALAGLAGVLLHTFIWVALALRSWSRWHLFQTSPELLPPESSYASPPWWTYDTGWAAPAIDPSPVPPPPGAHAP